MTQHSTNGTTMTLTVTGLHPYYTYSSRIAAATGAGMGPFSSATLLETLEDGKPNNLDRCSYCKGYQSLNYQMYSNNCSN